MRPKLKVTIELTQLKAIGRRNINGEEIATSVAYFPKHLFTWDALQDFFRCLFSSESAVITSIEKVDGKSGDFHAPDNYICELVLDPKPTNTYTQLRELNRKHNEANTIDVEFSLKVDSVEIPHEIPVEQQKQKSTQQEKLPRVFTTVKPTEPGYYLVRGVFDGPPTLVRVEKFYLDDSLVARFFGQCGHNKVSDCHYEWCKVEI